MRPNLLPVAILFSCLLDWTGKPAFAAVKPHALISEGMVLQRGMPVPIRGTAAENEKVTVRFQGQEATTTARDGQWMVRLRDLRPAGPFAMDISVRSKRSIRPQITQIFTDY